VIREADYVLEPFPDLGRHTDVACVRPGVDFGQRLVAPTEKKKHEVGVEGHRTLCEVEPLRERPARREQVLGECNAVGAQLQRLACRGLERRAQILQGSLVGKNDAELRLDLKGGRGSPDRGRATVCSACSRRHRGDACASTGRPARCRSEGAGIDDDSSAVPTHRPLTAARQGLRIVGGRRPWKAMKLQSCFEAA
jgi:hypothetical protein